jgi:hypothetical protein
MSSYNNLSGDSYNWAMFDDLTITDKTPPSDGLVGQVDLQDFHGDKTMVAVRLEFMQGSNVIASKTPVLDGSGNYSVSGLTAGTYDVAFKTSQSLRTVVSGVSVPGSCNVSLTNGDVDGDNHITTTDLSVVIANLE